MQPDRQRMERPSRAEGIVAVPHASNLPRRGAGRGAQRSPRGLDDQLNLSVTEIAVIWILHRGTSSSTAHRSLTRDIVEFYPSALKVIARAEGLRGVNQSDLRLIYFKGLIEAKTHPRQRMIEAIRRADRLLDRATAPSVPSEVAMRRPNEGPPSGDRDTLVHIADALGHRSESSH
jgi:hypothetical protein